MSANFVVYRRPAGPWQGSEGPTGLRLLRWSPTLRAAAPPEIAHDRNGFRKNWLYHLPAILFRVRKRYVVYMMIRDEEPVCQCILTPASSRFAFMQPPDWQLGLVYTAPAFRGQGLAKVMLGEILRERGESGAGWWLTESENLASRRLAESASFVRFGEAVRRRGLSGVPYFEVA